MSTHNKEAAERPLLDEDGENRAVRAFLQLCGQVGVTVEAMRDHMRMSGFELWPAWVETFDGHLTKAGAQSWLRYLFSLEAASEAPATEQAPEDQFAADAPHRRTVEEWLRRELGGVEADNIGKVEFSALVRLVAFARSEQAPAGEAPPDLRMLGYELEGVIIDVEQGHGFDDVCLGTIKRVRAALSTPPAVPPGYVIVPVEPTREMWAASGDAVCKLTNIGVHHDIVSRVVYDAMLSAAPTAPQTKEQP